MSIQALDDAIVAGLVRPESYPDDPDAASGIEHIQTHLSHVYLTRTRVYKLHKAARLSFVDFGSREARNQDALRELQLNRRLAPEVYLGVAPVLVSRGRVRLGVADESLLRGHSGEDPEHCVVMKRLPEGRDAQSLLERGELDTDHIDALASRIARFHANARLSEPAPFFADEWRERTLGPLRACFAELADSELAEDAERAAERARVFACERWRRFDRRRCRGRAVDGHGDLQLGHVWFEPGREPLVIDCIAFDPLLRRIDAASDVAFLAMDLRYRQRTDLAERFLARYANDADDHDLYAVVDFFIAYRAAVRAKVAWLATRDLELEPAQRERAAESARAHLSLALDALESPVPGALIAVSGTVGSGKSTAAAALAERLDGVVVSSDRVRKAAARLRPSESGRAAWRAGLYTPERTREVYAELAARAATIVASGRTAVLDATYASREERERLCAVASAADVRPILVEVEAAPDLARKRLAERRERGVDASDAGPELLEQSLKSYEPPEEWPQPDRFHLRTDQPAWQTTLGDVVERVSGSA